MERRGRGSPGAGAARGLRRSAAGGVRGRAGPAAPQVGGPPRTHHAPRRSASGAFPRIQFKGGEWGGRAPSARTNQTLPEPSARHSEAGPAPANGAVRRHPRGQWVRAGGGRAAAVGLGGRGAVRGAGRRRLGGVGARRVPPPRLTHPPRPALPAPLGLRPAGARQGPPPWLLRSTVEERGPARAPLAAPLEEEVAAEEAAGSGAPPRRRLPAANPAVPQAAAAAEEAVGTRAAPRPPRQRRRRQRRCPP